jgi:hypothetical protein
MTNILRYTPPPSKSFDTSSGALRGNMGSASFQQRGTGKAGLSRTEIVRSVRSTNAESRSEKANRKAFRVVSRTARVKRKPSISGFHVVGIGNVPQTTLNELRVMLKHGRGNFKGCSSYVLAGRNYKLCGKGAA